jgi:SAM-dependent methyltransferase
MLRAVTDVVGCEFTSSLSIDRDLALADLGRLLAQTGYRFTTVTPASHEVVNRRLGNEVAHDLQGVFGWNRLFHPQVLPTRILRAAAQAGVLESAGALKRSTVRFSSFGDRLFVHSAFPTNRRDSVFFGPDTYRFVNLVSRSLAGGKSLLELCCGAGAAAICHWNSYSRVVMADLNPQAVRYAGVNARINARSGGPPELEILESDLFGAIDGEFDAIIANPPYMIDGEHRLYRDGGARGIELAVRVVREGLKRLSPRGRLVLYTGVPISLGEDPFFDAVAPMLGDRAYSYDELEVDVFGGELGSRDYAEMDRIAVVALIVDALPGEHGS